MTNRTERGPAAHAGHDPLLIAQYAADDLDPRDRATAEALVNSCTECAELASDLRLIARATAALPETARPRDFTLSPEQAARLRRSGWRGFGQRLGLGWIRTDVGRTLAAGLTTLGLAGLLIGVVPGQLASSGGAAPPQTVGKSVDNAGGGGAAQPLATGRDQVASAGAAASAAPSVAAPEYPYGPQVDTTGEDPHASEPYSVESAPSGAPMAGGRMQYTPPPASQPNYLLFASLVALTGGVALFAVRRISAG